MSLMELSKLAIEECYTFKNRSRIAIVDGRSEENLVRSLKSVGFSVLPTVKCTELYEAIAYHPDIVLYPVNRNTLVVAPNVFDYYKEALGNRTIKLIKGEKKLERNYPKNIAYNVARVGRYAIHNFKYTDEKLTYYLRKDGIEFINVKQGYSKCSTAVISDKGIITSDHSIAKVAERYGIDVLRIESGFISLPGLNYGFVGGATGLLSSKELMLSGSYDNHPNKNNINNFLSKYGVKPIFLTNKEIIDIGSIITLDYN